MNTDINEYSNRRKTFAIERRAYAIPYLISGAIVLAISLFFSYLLNLPIEKLEILSVVTWTVGMATIYQCRCGFGYKHCEIGFIAGAVAFVLGSIGITLCFPIFVSKAFVICILSYGSWLIAMSFMHFHYEPFEKATGMIYCLTGLADIAFFYFVR